MIQLEINSRVFNIVSSYKEVSMGQYIDMLKITDAKLKLDQNVENMKMIAILSDAPEELETLLWAFTLEDFAQLMPYFAWVNDKDASDMLLKAEPVKEMIIDDKKYSITTNFNRMTMGEIVSFELILKNSSDFHRMEIAFGVLVRPVIDDCIIPFSQDVFDDIIKLKYKIKMVDIYAIISFFLSGEQTFSTSSTKAFSIHQSSSRD